MKRFILACLLCSSAFAAGRPAEGSLQEMPGIQILGSGCKLPERVSHHWEGDELVLNFEDLFAALGGGVPLSQSRKNCAITLNLRAPSGLSYAIESYSIQAYAYLGKKQKVEISGSQFFQGSADQGSFGKVWVGPLRGELILAEDVPVEKQAWSPCKAERATTINSAIRVSRLSGSKATDAGASLESMRLKFKLRRC